jgi:hypothetical protein
MPTQTHSRHRPRQALLAGALALAHASCAQADCIDDAAVRHQVNTVVLRAIGWQESRLQPQALGHNANGSVDVGAFQINSVHLSELGRYGIDQAALADGCTSAEVAAWHYRRQIDRFGDGWRAIGAYHSATPARAAWYANRVATILMRWRVLPSGALPFPTVATLAPDRSTKPSHGHGLDMPATPTAPSSARMSSALSKASTPGSSMRRSRTSPSPPSMLATPSLSEPTTPCADANAAACQTLPYLPPSR